MIKPKAPNRVRSSELVSRLEETVKYYERMHRDARTALDIAGRMSLEMKEQLIEARQKLERAKSANAPSSATGRITQDFMKQTNSTAERTPGSLHPACCVRASIRLEQWIATNRQPVTVGLYNGISLKAAGRKQTRDEYGNAMMTFYFKKAHNDQANPQEASK